MGLFGLGRKRHDEQKVAVVTNPDECVHGVRVPHWDSIEDMGRPERATYFVCESCGKHLSPEEDAQIKAAAPVETAGS